MIIPIKRSETQWEWVFLEFQGNVKNRVTRVLNDECFGTICFTDSHTPVLLIGIYVMIGKESTLPKPFAVLEKKPDSNTELVENQESIAQSEYIVKAIVRKKVTFKGRPRFVITSVPRLS